MKNTSIIFGGQFGSEGKGKVVDWFSRKNEIKVGIKVGGLNSGHITNCRKKGKIVFKQLPTTSFRDDTINIIAAGAMVNVDILEWEIKNNYVNPSSVYIDELSSVLTDDHIKIENDKNFNDSIGSTCSGTGACLVDRINRNNHILVRDIKNEIIKLGVNVVDTKNFMDELSAEGEKFVIEGTQGSGLSVFHDDNYPYVTSRDSSASCFLSESGLSPFNCENIVMVIRSFPIRVAGNSGEMSNELSWGDITKISNSNVTISEKTTVTKRTRRVQEFDFGLVKKSILINKPNVIVMNHLDYIDASIRGGNISKRVRDFVEKVEIGINQKIDYIGLNEFDIVNF